MNTENARHYSDEEVAAAYMSGLSMRAVGKKFDISLGSVQRSLARTETPRRAKSEAAFMDWAAKGAVTPQGFPVSGRCRCGYPRGSTGCRNTHGGGA